MKSCVWGVTKSAAILDFDSVNSVDHQPARKVQSVDVDLLQKFSVSMLTIRKVNPVKILE